MTVVTLPDGRSIEAVVTSIAGLLARGGLLSQGDVAALRRMDPWRPAPAFFKLEGLVLDPVLAGDAERRADQETRWAAVVVGLAMLGHAHVPGRRLGLALAGGDCSELRFTRLLRSDAERLVDELPALARFVAARGFAVDWTDAARLILSAGRSDEESVRRHIARDFFGVLARQD